MAKLRRIKSSDKIRNPKTRKLIKSSAENFIDPKTKKIYSRRQAGKILGKPLKKPVKNRQYEARGGQLRYLRLRDDFIDKQKQKGIKLKPRAAGQNEKFIKLLSELKRGGKLKAQGKNVEGNKLILRALKRTTRRDGISDVIIPGESPKRGESDE